VTGLPWYDEATKGGSLLHLGVSASYIDPGGTNIVIRSRPEARTANRFVNSGGSGLLGADYSYIAGVEGAVVLGPFSVQAEYFRQWVEQPADNPAFDGFYIFGSWFITGEHRNYRKASGTFDRVIPHKNFTDGGIGAWGLALRYSHTELNDDAFTFGRLNNITAGVNWYLNPNAKLQFNYVRANVDRGNTDGILNVFQGAAVVDF